MPLGIRAALVSDRGRSVVGGSVTTEGVAERGGESWTMYDTKLGSQLLYGRCDVFFRRFFFCAYFASRSFVAVGLSWPGMKAGATTTARAQHSKDLRRD